MQSKETAMHFGKYTDWMWTIFQNWIDDLQCGVVWNYDVNTAEVEHKVLWTDLKKQNKKQLCWNFLLAEKTWWLHT